MEEKINNRYHSKAITIRGTTYPSQQAAAEALGVSFHAVHIAKKRGRLDFLGIGRGGLQSALQELISENAKLRADLAKAVEAMVQIAGKKDYADDPWDIARATLEELKG